MKNTQNYTIKLGLETDLTALSALESNIKRIKSDANIKLDGEALKSLETLETRAATLKETISTLLSSDNLSADVLKRLKEPLDILVKDISVFKKQAANISLSKKASEEFNKLEEDLKSSSQELSKLESQLNGYKKSLESVYALSNKNKVASAEAGGTLTAPNSNRIINQYSTIEKYYHTIDKTSKNLTESEQQIIKAWNNIQNTLADQEAKYAEAIKNTGLQLDKTKQKMAEAKAGQEKLLASSTSNNNLKDTITDMDKLSEIFKKDYNTSVSTANKTQQSFNTTIETFDKVTEKSRSTLGKAINNVITYGTVVSAVRRIYTGFINTITELDAALTDMTVVTDLSRDKAWEMTSTFQDLAHAAGTTTVEVANVTTKFLQQGKTVSDSLVLAESALKAAKIAGISGEESVKLLTNALNGFQMSAEQAVEVSDKFAALAAASATDYEGLATALSKVAAQANLAGMSMDFTLGLLAKGIETTQEAPETIGTALKTVIARMRELTDYGATLEDGIDVNRVEKALDNVGVALRDTNGEFRSLDDVLSELGQSWDSLNTNQQANVAVALAGTRQQSRLIAMMQDFDRTEQLVEISMNSAGATMAQHSKYMKGLEAATARASTAYQGLVTSIMKSDVAIAVINGISGALEFLSKNINVVYAAVGALLAVYAPLIANKLADVAATTAAQLWTLTHAKQIHAEKAAVAELNHQKALGAKRTAELTAAQKANLLTEKELNLSKLEAVVENDKQSLAENELTQATIKNSIAKQEGIIVAARANRASYIRSATLSEEKIKKLEAAQASTELKIQELELIEAQTGVSQQAEIMNAKLNQSQYEMEIQAEKTKLANTQLKINQAESKKASAETQLAILKNRLSTAEIEHNTFANKLAEDQLNKNTASIEAQNAAIDLQIAKQAVSNAALEVTNAAAQRAIEVGGGWLKSKMQSIAALGLEKMGLDSTRIARLLNIPIQEAETAAETANTATKGSNTVATALNEEAQEELNEEKAKSVGLNAASAAGSLLDKKAKDAQSKATAKATVTQHANNAAMMASPITWIVLAVAALVAIIAVAVKNSEELQESFKELGDSLMGILESLMEVIKPLIGIVITIIEGLAEALTPILQFIVDLLVFVADIINVIVKVIGGIVGIAYTIIDALMNNPFLKWINPLTWIIEGFKLLGKLLDPLGKGLKKIGKWFVDLFKTGKDEIEDFEDAVKENAEKRYEAQEKENKLEPLVTEYEEIKNKKNKTIEDYQRLDEITGAIKDIDENLIGANGQLLLTDAKREVERLRQESDRLLQQSVSLLKIIQNSDRLSNEEKTIALNSESNKTVLKDMSTDILLKNDKLSAIQVRAIQDRVGNAIDITKLEAGVNIDAYVAELTGVFTEIESFTGEETKDQVANFVNAYNGASDEVKEALKAAYGEYYLFMTELQLSDTGWESINKLGFSAEEIQAMAEASGDSTKFYARLQQILNQGGSMESMGAAIAGLGSEFGLAGEAATKFNDTVTQSIGKDAVGAVEEFKTALSEIENLEEFGDKIFSGKATPEDIQQMQKDHPEWFTDERLMSLLNSEDIQGFNDYIEELKKENDKAMIERLNTENGIHAERMAQLEALKEAQGGLTDEQQAELDNLNSQIKANDVIINQLKIQGLLKSSKYQDALNETAEQKRANMIDHNVAEFEKEIEKDKEKGIFNLGNYEGLKNTYEVGIAENNRLLQSEELQQILASGVGSFVNGKLKINAEPMATLNETNPALGEWLANNEEAIDEAYVQNKEWTEALEDLNNDIKDQVKERVQEELEAQKELLEKEKEAINERKEAYEEYWDNLDSLEDEQEREASIESINKQLATLAGGSGSATSAQRKELLQQLQDLQKEDLEAQRQAQRDALQKSMDEEIRSIEDKVGNIDSTISGLDDAFEGVTSSNEALERATNILGKKFSDYEIKATAKGTFTEMEISSKTPHYAEGGLVTYTGPAWVDGTPSKPEAFLSSIDTSLIQKLITQLKVASIQDIPTSTSMVNIENITIQTNELNNNQDWRTAGRTLAEEFAEETKKRGINQNVNTRYRR